MSQVIALERGACFIPEPLGRWRVAEQSFSGQMRADREWQEKIADEAYGLMTGTFADRFPGSYARTWLREEQVRLELEAERGNLGRLRRELGERRRLGLSLRPVLTSRMRFRLHSLLRRRIARKSR
jgi:hypothetical protein